MRICATICITAVVAVISLLFLWSRERTKRALLQRELLQSTAEIKVNKRANEEFTKKQKARSVNSNLDRNDPWAGLRPTKDKISKLHNNRKT